MAGNSLARRAQAAAQFDVNPLMRPIEFGHIRPTFAAGGREMLLAQRARQRAGARTFGFFGSLGKALGGIGKAALGVARVGFQISPAGQALAAAQQALTGPQVVPQFIPGRGIVGPGIGTPPPPGTQLATSFTPISSRAGAASAGAGCPAGFRLVNGRCVESGFRGGLERLLPGGEPGMLTEDFGEAVMGAFGVPALEPAQVGSVQRADGSVGPILKCPPGAVLGRDNLCYTKGTIPMAMRKWRPAKKPPISRKDWDAAKAIGRVQKKVKRLAGDTGLTCKKR